MSKKLDPAIKSLMAMDRAMSYCPSRMWRANIEYIWDAWLTNPKAEAKTVLKREEDLALGELRKRIKDEMSVFTPDMKKTLDKIEKSKGLPPPQKIVDSSKGGAA